MAPMSPLAVLALLGLAVSPAAAFFRLPCKAPVLVERADPVVNPGVASPHLHTISGGNGFGFNMDYASTQASTCSTCTVEKDNSNYWIPNLWFQNANGSFTSVPQVGGILVYYLFRPGNGEKLTAFPPGFRMLAGDPMKRSFGNDKASRAINYACLDYNGPGKSETNDFPKYNCPNGIRAQVFFPSCWDGKNLDSADHKTHVVYPAGDTHEYGNCPSTHPIHFPSLFFEVIFSTDLFASQWSGGKQPFVWSMGDPTGYGLHGDFVNGWDVDLLQRALNDCTNDSGKVEDCKHFKLIPDNVVTGCRIPNSINEPVSGTLPALPGCNPIQAGPQPAVSKQQGCTVSNEIGQPAPFFTDLTQSKKFAYVGCGYDSIYNRKFTGASTSGNDMTVEKCVDFCTSKGFSIAGPEYGRECYCANSIPADAAPKPGYIGDCQYRCAGDNKQFCGGAGTISLYQKCTGSTCENAKFGKAGGSGGGSSPAPSASAVSSSTRPASSVPAPSGTTRPASSAPAPSSVTSRTASSSAPAASTSGVTLPSGWKSLGCYIDPVNPRLLTSQAKIAEADVTSTKCVDYCFKNGFDFAGSEFGQECFCSKTLPSNAKTAYDRECNTPCRGNAKEICGGGARLSVYGKKSGSVRRFSGHGGHGRPHAIRQFS